MKATIFILFLLFCVPVNSKEATGTFDAPAGNYGSAHNVPVDSDMYFGCEFEVSEYRNNEEWGPYFSLHFADVNKKEAIAIHFTKSLDDYLIFSVNFREKGVNSYEEKILTLKRTSDVITMSMAWSNKVMYFDVADNTGQASKFFLIAPKFTPEEASLSVSGGKGTYRCNAESI
jgi:hypothetical protein